MIYRPGMSTPGDRLRTRRQKAGLSQQDFAKHIGVAQSTVHKYETGTIPISGEIAIRIAKRFRCDPEEFAPESVDLIMRDAEDHVRRAIKEYALFMTGKKSPDPDLA